MDVQDVEKFYPKSIAEWHDWLRLNHSLRSAVWLVFYSRASGKPSVSWSEAVDVALCFGWIDSKKVKLDHESSLQYFSPRKAKSTWSRINKEKIDRLTKAGLMSQAGLAAVETARGNGSWTVLDEVEALIVPKDLEARFQTNPGMDDFFKRLSRSERKAILHRIALSKLPATREKRITEIVSALALKQGR
ncbi:MAG TPA: YdeI/OmpD-associated family protein [Sphingobacteriaceae bacterium]